MCEKEVLQSRIILTPIVHVGCCSMPKITKIDVTQPPKILMEKKSSSVLQTKKKINQKLPIQFAVTFIMLSGSINPTIQTIPASVSVSTAIHFAPGSRVDLSGSCGWSLIMLYIPEHRSDPHDPEEPIILN